MFLPIRTDSPLRRTPYVNVALIVINLVAFVLQRSFRLESRFMLNPADLHWYQFVTYAFLHGDVVHIFSNMLFLYIFGNNVCDKMGSIAYLGFYLGGAVFAGIGHLFTSSYPVLGASGAVAAVTGAYMILLPRSHITVIYLLFFVGFVEIPSIYFVLFFFLQDVVLGLVGLERKTGGGVAHMAHVAGSVFGMTVCLTLLWVRLLPRDQYDVLGLLDRWNRRRAYRGMVNSGYNPFDYTQARSRVSANIPPTPEQQRIANLRGEISSAIASQNLDVAARLYLQLRAVDPTQVLPRQTQLDIANQLAGQQMYTEAAEAYEAFIKAYPKFEQMEQVELMLGIIYARYLQQYPKAREFLVRALAKLHGQREIDMAKSELTRIEMGMAGLG
jgi:membrane associated rhomboid family serine protease